MHNPEPSECSCHLEPGEWGACGWHYYRMTEARFVQQEMFRYFQTLKGSIKGTQAEEDRARRDAAERAQHYIGQPVAFQQCPHYVDAVKREIAVRKATQENPLKSKRDYSERDWT